MTYGDVLNGNPDSAAIMSILRVKPRDNLPQHRFEPDPHDRKFERELDLVEYLRNSERGLHLVPWGPWWNYYDWLYYDWLTPDDWLTPEWEHDPD